MIKKLKIVDINKKKKNTTEVKQEKQIYMQQKLVFLTLVEKILTYIERQISTVYSNNNK